ncbi:unnamed protein product [Alopecurus aequalis]
MAAAELDWAIPVFERAKDSIFFVVISPRNTMIGEIETLAGEVNTVEKDEQPDRCRMTMMSTGFIVGTRGNRLLILTTAHSIDHVFKGSKPIGGNQANQLFQASILCDHYELDYRAAGLATSKDDSREYVPADIIGINCRRDLLLIEVERSKIKGRSSNLMCDGIHPPLQISRNLATAGEQSMLLSWPFDKHRRVATGCVGVRRNVREVSRPNSIEYRMEILEANITSESGSSGAPLLNKSSDVIGALHGGFGKSHSYFIPSDLIRDFLAPFVTTSDQRKTVEVGRKRKVKEIMGERKESGNQHKHRRLQLK